MDQNRNKPIPNDRNHLSKPQIFVQLAFGVSWSQRHAPQTHTVTYMSRNLKNARDSGNFPRQVPSPTTNFLAPEQRQNRREHPGRHHHQNNQHHPIQNGCNRPHTGEQSSDQLRPRPRRGSTDEALHGRGRSAPPPFNNNPWDVHHASALSIFPHGTQDDKGPSQMWKALPAPPTQFRLGEDGLPWSSWAPVDVPDSGEDGGDWSYANGPVPSVPISTEQPRTEDPERVRELESLSTAMMTVDNGFEHQWWYQGQRESVESWWPRDLEASDDAGTMSTAEATLLANIEPPSAIEPDDDNDYASNYHVLVSPISDVGSPTQGFSQPLHRSLTTRSEELWLER